ncbi:hypothetical protein [Helicobacter suis]|uniref:hypothetical protein n=1 Tax=Helicobacter suis TaxID=104628 RepID=UPI001596A269|nr:hypothetical protein [Helicobacter suis]
MNLANHNVPSISLEEFAFFISDIENSQAAYCGFDFVSLVAYSNFKESRLVECIKKLLTKGK